MKDETQEILDYCNRVFNYNPDTGEITNKLFRGYRSLAGSQAGHLSSDGYRMIYIHGVLFFSHRIGYAMHTGNWPKAPHIEW